MERTGRGGVGKDMKKRDTSTSTMDFVLQEDRSNILVVAKETSREI